MNLSRIYFNIQSQFFPMAKEKIGEITEKLQEFLRIIELVKPSRFITELVEVKIWRLKLGQNKFVIVNATPWKAAIRI